MASTAAPAMPTGMPGRLLVMAAATGVLLAVLTGNLFALHAGMTASPAAHVAAETEGSVPVVEVADRAPSEAAMSPMPADPDAQQTMHVLGACLTVLVAAGLLILARLTRRTTADGYAATPARDRVLPPAPRDVWRPPPLRPPSSSPVIRT